MSKDKIKEALKEDGPIHFLDDALQTSLFTQLGKIFDELIEQVNHADKPMTAENSDEWLDLMVEIINKTTYAIAAQTKLNLSIRNFYDQDDKEEEV